MEAYLLIYPTYTSYLDKFLTTADRRYASSIEIQRMIVQNREEKYGNIYTESQFTEKTEQMLKNYFPYVNLRLTYFSRRLKTTDRFLRELGLRERLNRLKVLSSIIFLRSRNKRGFEISGFIDFEDSLKRATGKAIGAVDWEGVFKERTILRPKKTDLSYFNVYTGKVSFNSTNNYNVIHKVEGLTFTYRGDHKSLCVGQKVNYNYSRSNFFSKIYGDVTIYDHIIQKKV